MRAAITKNIKSRSKDKVRNAKSQKIGSIDIVNSPTTGSVQTAANLVAQKNAILQKIMSQLSALQAQASNSGHTSTTNDVLGSLGSKLRNACNRLCALLSFKKAVIVARSWSKSGDVSFGSIT
jgi:hypothetical protein